MWARSLPQLPKVEKDRLNDPPESAQFSTNPGFVAICKVVPFEGLEAEGSRISDCTCKNNAEIGLDVFLGGKSFVMHRSRCIGFRCTGGDSLSDELATSIGPPHFKSSANFQPAQGLEISTLIR